MAVDLSYLIDGYTPYFGYLIILFFLVPQWPLCSTILPMFHSHYFVDLANITRVKGPKRFKVFYDQDILLRVSHTSLGSALKILVHKNKFYPNVCKQVCFSTDIGAS